MELSLAQTLIEATLAEGVRRGARPLAVVVLDAGGNMVACARQDGASFGRLKLAEGKAWGSLSLGFGSRTLSERVATAPSFFSAAASLLRAASFPRPAACCSTAVTTSSAPSAPRETQATSMKAVRWWRRQMPGSTRVRRLVVGPLWVRSCPSTESAKRRYR